MSLREQDFNPSAALWAPSFHNDHHPIAARGYSQAMAQAAGTPGADMGMLLVRNGVWQIFMGSWVDFNPADPAHLFHANAFNRYSKKPTGELVPGWSYGPFHGWHDEALSLFEEVEGRRPTLQEKMDIDHDKGLWESLRRRQAALHPITPTTPVTPTPPVTPPTPTPIDLGARLAEAEATIARLKEASDRQAAAISTTIAALQSVKNIAERDLASIPKTGGGRPAIEARKAHFNSLVRIIEEARNGGAQ